MMSTDKSDALLSSSNNTDTLDDMSKGIDKVCLEDVNNKPPCDIISSGEEDMSSEEKYTSCDQKIEHIKTHEISHSSGSSNTDTTDSISGDVDSGAKKVSKCTNCGKDGPTNTCNKCKIAKYCNAACKKRHRHKHKKECEEHLKRAAELREEELKRTAELHDIELFKKPPAMDDDCPICFQRLPLLVTGRKYKSCCGKMICSGCIHAVVMTRKTIISLCPFCRVESPTTDKDSSKRIRKRVDAGDADAMHILGGYYSHGRYGVPQDHTKALELFHHHQAAELGHAAAYCSIGYMYVNGRGVARDRMKAVHYLELAAMRGCTPARYNLGVKEADAGNMDRALKHFMIAIEDGDNMSLDVIHDLHSKGHASKDDYTKALRAYQKYLDEVKSKQRDEAAAFDEGFKYIE